MASGEAVPLRGQGHDHIELPRFDIAPQPLVGFVAHAEVIDLEALFAGFLDVFVEQELAGAGGRKFIVADCAEFADEPFAAAAGAGYGAQLAADFQPLEREASRAVAQCVGEKRVKERLDLGSRKDIGDAGLAEPLLLHLEEGVEQPADLLRRVRHDAAEAAAASNLRTCARCFLRLRLPLVRSSTASNPDRRSTASAILGLGTCGKASSGFL